MWWGRGDSSKLSTAEKKTLGDLRRLEETGHIRTLNADKADVAIRSIEFYGSIESVFRLMSGVRNVALLVGALLAVWWATQGAIIEWIKAAIGV